MANDEDISRSDGGFAEAGTAGWGDPVEAHHRLANGFLLTTAMLRDESRHVTDPASARAALEAASLRLMAMSRLHRQLGQTRPGARVELGTFLDPIRGDIEDSVGATILLRVAPAEVTVEAAAQVASILGELATNAVKHHGGTGHATVAVEIVHGACGGLRMLVEDDGPGLPDGFDVLGEAGLGMRIVGAAVQRLCGTIRTVPSDGAAFEIAFPIL